MKINFFLLLLTCLFFPLFFSYSQTVKDSLLNLVRTTNPTDTIYLLSLAELSNEFRYDNPDTSLILAQETIELSKKINYEKGIGRGTRLIGIYYRNKGNIIEAIRYFESSVISLEKSKDMEGLAFTYNSLAAVYKNQANSTLAIECCLKAMSALEKTANQKGVAYVLNNLVGIYLEQGNYNKALEYAQQSLVISEKLNDSKGLFYSYFNIGEIYQHEKQYEKALEYQLKNLKISEKTDDKLNTSYACNDIGFTYIELKQYKKVLPYLQKSLRLANEIKSIERKTEVNTTFCKYYNAINQPQIAFKYGDEALKLAKSLKNVTFVSAAAKEFSIASAKIGNYQVAFDSYQLYKQTADSLQNEKKYKESLQKDYAYQQEKQNLEQEKKQVEYAAELEQQKIIRNGFIVGFILMMGLVFGAFWAYRNKQKTNNLLAKQNKEISLQKEATQKALEVVKMQQVTITEANKEMNQANEELHQQQEELMTLNNHLETQKQTLETTYTKLKFTSEQLNKSISYASNIQNIILPETEDLTKFFAEIFTIYKPRDVVSGDFYWFSQITESQAIFVMADCTGHGVPGAFMSMLGCTLLHEIVNTKELYANPALILQELDTNLRYLLKQDKGLNSDGMDISVCFFEKKQELNYQKIANNNENKAIKLTFAGAKSLMYYIANNEISQISGDKIYLGGKGEKQTFTNKIFDFQADIIFYLLTDGIIDQNNEQRTKLGVIKLKETILANHSQNMETQKEILLELLHLHQLNAEQRDDISMIGLRVW